MKALFIFICLFIIIFSSQAQTDSIGSNKTYGITFSLPWFNSYRYVDYEQKANEIKSGFFGLGFAGYCKQGKNKISFNCGYTQDLSSPIGAIDYSKEGKKTHIGSAFGELIYQRPIYEGLGAIIGFNYSSYTFQFINYSDNLPLYKKVDNTLGGSVGIEYRFNKYISVATIYRPAFASFETDNIYRHIISVDVRIDLDVLTLFLK
jgi:hypothetical protein